MEREKMTWNFLILLLWFTASLGQLDLISPDSNAYEKPFNLKGDDAILKKYLPIRTPKEQRFLEGLIVEAGRHVLFPDMYVPNKETEERNREKNMFYELKGDPEVVETYMDRRSRSELTRCPEDCPFYKPVCGTDGKVYESECHMAKENCRLGNVSTGPWDICRGKHYLCPSECLDLSDPVCGSDGMIYHNVCVMRKRNCGKLLDARAVRYCYRAGKDFRSLETCPKSCHQIYKPVCGSNGIIYYNECFLRMRTCRDGIVEVEMDSCAKTSLCPDICLPIYDPVCGSDGELYINGCRMQQQNCGKDIKKMPKRFCNVESKEISASSMR